MAVSPTLFHQELADARAEIAELVRQRDTGIQEICQRQQELEAEVSLLRPLRLEVVQLEATARAAISRSSELANAYQELREDRGEGTFAHADLQRVHRLDRLEAELRRLLPLEVHFPRFAEEFALAEERQRRATNELYRSECLAREAALRSERTLEESVHGDAHIEHALRAEVMRAELANTRGELEGVREALDRLSEEHAHECHEVSQLRTCMTQRVPARDAIQDLIHGASDNSDPVAWQKPQQLVLPGIVALSLAGGLLDWRHRMSCDSNAAAGSRICISEGSSGQKA